MAPSITEVIRESLDEIKADVRRLGEAQLDLVKVQTHQAAVLDEHVRRTEAAEASIALLRQEVEPLKVGAAVWSVVGKVIAAGGALVTAAVGIGKLLG